MGRGGRVGGEVRRNAPFELEVDGHRVRIEPDAKTTIRPLFQRTMQWNDLERDPALRELRRSASGHDAQITVRRAEVHDGDRVAIEGEVLGDEMTDVLSHRVAAERRITVLAAR